MSSSKFVVKSTVFILALLGCFAKQQILAQTVNDVPLKDIDVEYLQIVGTSKLFSTKLTIELDFGQENRFWSQQDTQLKDSTGKNLVFNSMIDALNFLSKNGYEFVQAYAFSIANQNIYHYLMRRRNRQPQLK